MLFVFFQNLRIKNVLDWGCAYSIQHTAYSIQHSALNFQFSMFGIKQNSSIKVIASDL